MKRYATAYVIWLIGVLAMAAIAWEWYRHVENIGWTELAARIAETDGDSPPPPED